MLWPLEHGRLRNAPGTIRPVPSCKYLIHAAYTPTADVAIYTHKREETGEAGSV
jgi:hypothetical protein